MESNSISPSNLVRASGALAFVLSCSTFVVTTVFVPMIVREIDLIQTELQGEMLEFNELSSHIYRDVGILASSVDTKLRNLHRRDANRRLVEIPVQQFGANRAQGRRLWIDNSDLRKQQPLMYHPLSAAFQTSASPASSQQSNAQESVQQQYTTTSDKCECFYNSFCDVGPPGPPGPKGHKGNDGLTGYPGHPGFDAESIGAVRSTPECFYCAQGPPGLPGQYGIAGTRGKRGATGTRGWAGKNGNPGWPGMPGVQGYPGKTGRKGRPGMTGYNRRQPLGFPGPKGEPGVTGDAGYPGDPGQPGANGKRGILGKQGYIGETGPPGKQGRSGGYGPSGYPGRDGQYCPCPATDPHPN